MKIIPIFVKKTNNMNKEQNAQEVINGMYAAIEKAAKQCADIMNEASKKAHDVTTLEGSNIEIWKADFYEIFAAHLKTELFCK